GDGNDLLITDQGDDTLTGGLGNDLFALTDEPGINLITDFTTNQDKFLLTSNISFSQLTFTNITGGTSINLGDRSLAEITGINVKQITVNDFQSMI
ncbi:MAG: calcium-binding protein, partial [Microcoleaceae cyanobacterium]